MKTFEAVLGRLLFYYFVKIIYIFQYLHYVYVMQNAM